MIDISKTIEPKSDQLNADDLMLGYRFITITEVTMQSGDQPISIFFEGDNGKPFKPCKSMRRILMKGWGVNAIDYTGRHLQLYNDVDVVYAGKKVGGIRIKSMSHIDKPFEVPLTISKAKRIAFKVKKLEAPDPKAFQDAMDALKNAKSMDEIKTIWIDNKALHSNELFKYAKDLQKSEIEGATDEPAI